MKPGRPLRWALVVAGVVAAIVLLRATVLRPKPLEVEAARVERGVVADVVTNSQAGTVRSRRRSRLGAEAAGRVIAIPRREGSRVRAREVLLELDPVPSQLQVDLARRDHDAAGAGLAAARSAATLARREAERMEQLHQERVISQEQLDQSRARRQGADAELNAAQARLQRARSALRLAQDTAGRLRVRAPFDGVVTQRFVEVGESVVPGQAVLEVMSPTDLYVSAPIDEVDIGRLRVGLPARVTLDPYPGVSWPGTVVRVAPYVSDVLQQNRTLEVEVDLPPDPSRPLPAPGASADVEIVLLQKQGALRVPTFAVMEGGRVLVLERGRAVERRIETGLRNWEWTEITAGLKEGETVITSLDTEGLKAGVSAKPRPKAAAGPAPTPAGTAP